MRTNRSIITRWMERRRQRKVHKEVLKKSRDIMAKLEQKGYIVRRGAWFGRNALMFKVINKAGLTQNFIFFKSGNDIIIQDGKDFHHVVNNKLEVDDFLKSVDRKFRIKRQNVLGNISRTDDVSRAKSEDKTKYKMSEKFDMNIDVTSMSKKAPVNQTSAKEDDLKNDKSKLYARDREIYGTKLDISERMNNDLKELREKNKKMQQEYEQIKKKNPYLAKPSETVEITNKDLTLDVTEKLANLLPGFEIKYDTSFGIGGGKRMCNFDIKLGDNVSHKCALISYYNSSTNEPTYSVSTSMSPGILSAKSVDDLARQIAYNMIADVRREVKEGKILTVQQQSDLEEAARRVGIDIEKTNVKRPNISLSERKKSNSAFIG